MWKSASGVIAIALAFTFAAVPAQAAERLNGFVGIDVMTWNYEENGVGDLGASTLRLRAGQDVTPYVGWEVHLATGGDDAVSGANLELDWLYSLFMRGTLPYGNARISALVGLTGVNMNGTPGLAISDGESGLSLGGIADYAITDRFRASIDYIMYMDQSDLTITAFSFGVAYTF